MEKGMNSLSNPFLQLTVYPEQLSFTLNSTPFTGAKIDNANFGLKLAESKNPEFVLQSVQEDQEVQTNFGRLKQLT